MNISDTFRNTVLIFLSSKTVMLNIVNHLQPESTLKSVPQLEFESS